MKLSIQNNGVSIEYEKELIDKLFTISKAHYPKEFGGFLIGYYSEDKSTLHITDSIEPKTYKHNNISFTRDSEGTESQFDAFYQCSPPQYYIGEWHTHPNGSSSYSAVDLKAMQGIAKESSSIKNPILLILGITNLEVTNYTFYVFKNNRILDYR